MSVPRTLTAFHGLRLLPAVLLLLAASTFVCAKGPEPPLRVPLSPLGFQPPTAATLAVGSMSTVEFIDEEHLLITFAVHRLMRRLPDDPADDQDRTIEAVVVHLPSGNVLARTQWRVHDSGRYLWNLGHGRFLLRIRDSLSTIAPLANITSHDPFVEQPLLASKRVIVVVLLSPDRDLLTVETVQRPSAATAGDPPPGFQHSDPPSMRAQLNFFRLLQPEQPVDKILLRSAGVIASDAPVDISLTSAGYIEVSQQKHDRWLFDFDPYKGKYVELSSFNTSCRPHPYFVSSSEFVAFGCKDGDDRQTIAGFNMSGQQMWQQDFSDIHAFASFAAAPLAGRFALSRNIFSAKDGMTPDFAPSMLATQEIRVYQTHSGQQLLRVEASPVQRSGDNFDLSPEGLHLAVIRGNAVEVHTLPALTEADRAAIRKAKAVQPVDVQAAVTLMPHGKAGAVAGIPMSAAMQTQVPAPTPSARTTAGDQPTDKPEDKSPSK